MPDAYQLVTQATTRSFQAQVRVNRVMTSAEKELKAQFGYRILYVTRLTKDMTRVMQKVLLEVKTAPPATPLATIVRNATSDLAGGRLLVVGTQQTAAVLQAVRAMLAQKGWALGKPGQYVRAPKPGTNGWRGIVQDVQVPIGGGVTAPFQLQVMTYLQHAWDQLEHAFYEHRRTGGGFPASAARSLGRLSKDLYIQDRAMSLAWRRSWNLVVAAAGQGRRRQAARKHK